MPLTDPNLLYGFQCKSEMGCLEEALCLVTRAKNTLANSHRSIPLNPGRLREGVNNTRLKSCLQKSQKD